MFEQRTLYIIAGGVATLALVTLAVFGLAEPPDARPAALPASSQWLVAAPGRVEPISGEIHVGSALLGKLADVFVHEGGHVEKNAVVAQLEDGEYRARLRSAIAEVTFRQSERDSALGASGQSERAEAAASIAAAEKEAAAARSKLEEANKSGQPAAVAEARKALSASESKLTEERRNLSLVQAMGKSSNSSRTESALGVARAAMAEAEAVLEKTRIRSPISGVVLRNLRQTGEIVGGTADDVIFVIGNILKLRVHAQIDERDVARVALDQRAYVIATTFGEHRFPGRVSRIGKLVNRNTFARGSSTTNTDANGLDVYIDLDDSDKLVSGMRVDAFVVPDAAPATNASVKPAP